MKVRKLIFLFTAGFALISCREEINQPSSVDPNIGGVYKEVSGGVKGTFALKDAPFLITDDIVVAAGDTLSIEPGVGLFFQQNTMLMVNGAMIANGTNERPIIFGPYLTDDWLGINIEGGESISQFKFCIIEGVYQPIEGQNKYGAVAISNSNAEIKNCIFRYNYTPYGGGLSLINTNAIVVNNIFRSNDAEIYGGAMFVQRSTITIINNTFYDNFSHSYGGAIAFDNPLATEIQNNIFYYNISFSGDRRIFIIEGDSTNINQQYNFLAPDGVSPKFISSQDLHLSPESPCMNSGNPEEEYNDFNNTRNDQGAYGGPGGNW